jgi:hypothetical protein
MCWQCDNPDATDEDYFNMVQGLIDKHGWFVQGVEKDRWRPGYNYTVGLSLFGHAELVVTGMKHRDGVRFLDGVAHQLVCHDAPPFFHGERSAWPEGPMTEAVDVAEPTVHLVVARELFGPRIRAVQLVYADDRGRWPWEVGFRGDQPVLGPRAEAWIDH